MGLVNSIKYNRIIILYLAIRLLAVSDSFSQQMFYSQLLQNLYHSLPETCKIDTNTVGTVVLRLDEVSTGTVPLVFYFDENKVIEHIGYRLLPIGDTLATNIIVRYIERELLSLLLTNDINQTFISYRENGLSILLNEKPVSQSLLQDKRGLLKLLKNYRAITINYIDGKKYEVSLSLDKEQKLSFHFPADSELITGMDKMERDIRIAVQLKNHKEKSDRVVLPDYSYLQLLRDTIYIDKGSSFLIPKINNDLFYVKADSTYNLALDKTLIAESFANALNVSVGNNYKINITQRMYGKIVKEYTVNSRDFDDYFLRDYDRYFGIETLEKDNLTGTLILNDRNAGCIHMAFVTMKLDDLINGGTMEMKLYSNIPQHNIKTLFDK